MDLRSRKLIVGCGNELAEIVDGDSGQILSGFKVGKGVDATAFDPAHGLAFVSAGQGLLTVLSEGDTGFQIQQELTTIAGSRTLAVDESSGAVFLPFAEFTPATTPGGRPTIVPDSFGLLKVGK